MRKGVYQREWVLAGRLRQSRGRAARPFQQYRIFASAQSRRGIHSSSIRFGPSIRYRYGVRREALRALSPQLDPVHEQGDAEPCADDGEGDGNEPREDRDEHRDTDEESAAAD